MDLRSELASIVGDEFVSDRLPERFVYSFDMTENRPLEPKLIVMPGSVDDVQRVVKTANRTKTPVVPYITGQNVGGLTIPQVDGAIVLDLRRMNRIVEVDEEAMYAVVEPGVTFGHLRKHLDNNHPSLRYTYPLAPPYTSVLANALLQGLCDLSTKYGAMGDFINGLEAVLPTGDLVRVGTSIMGDGNWFGRYPLPDLVGLFSGWQGMSGVVTKMAVQLWPKPEHTEHAALFTFGEHETVDLIKRITRAQLVDDADCMSLPIVKMLLGVTAPVETYHGEPDYGTLLTVSGHNEAVTSEKLRAITAIVDEAKRKEPRQLLVQWNAIAKLMGDQAQSWVDFPSDAFKVLTEYDGLTWVGTYIHPKSWGDALAGGRRIVEKYGFELMAFLKPMKGGHFSEFKFIIRFPKDRATVERVRRCNEELLDMALSLKAIPYKTPVWSARKLQAIADPEYVRLLKRIRSTLDPNGIMNPGRWAL